MNKRRNTALLNLQTSVYRTLYTSRNQMPAGGLCNIVSAEELRKLLATVLSDYVLIDSRTPEEYDECHIHGATNIPEKVLTEALSALPADKNTQLIFYCNGLKCGKSSRSARRALALGYRNVTLFPEGMPVWEEKGFPFFTGPGYSKRVKTVRITPLELWESIASDPDSFQVIDVCDKEEFAAEHIPGAINLPLASFATGSGIIDKQHNAVVYCKSGGRSHAAYKKLMDLDYKRIYQLVLDDWKAAGLPLSMASAIEKPDLPSELSAVMHPGHDTPGVFMSVLVTAPLQRVFDFVTAPHNWRRYVTGLKEIRYRAGGPLASGDIFSWTYSMRGIDIVGGGKVVEIEKNRKMSLQMHTLMPIKKTIFFEEAGDKTIIRVAVSCDAPGKIMSFLFKSATKMINRKESAIILERIKALCEEDSPEDSLPPETAYCPISPDTGVSRYQGGILSSALASAFL